MQCSLKYYKAPILCLLVSFQFHYNCCAAHASNEKNCFFKWNFQSELLIWFAQHSSLTLKGVSFEKKGLFLTYFSLFLVTREKLQKFLQHISQTHTYTYFAHPIDFFCLTNFEKIQIYQVRFLFGMSPSVDSYSRHFGTINK